MKRIILLMMLSLAIFSQTEASRLPDPVEQTIMRSLREKFPGAEFSTTRKIENEELYTVRLVYQNEALLAYVDEAGELKAVVRSMTRSRLPMLVNLQLTRNYEGYTMRQAEELSMNGETSYMFLMQNEREQVTVRVYATGDARVIKRSKLN